MLWDIDKTLVDIGAVSREIYSEAFESVTGQVLSSVPNMAGRTDRDLTMEALRLHGIARPESYLAPFYEALVHIALARQEDIRRRGRRLPGALNAVLKLDRPGVVQSVVTGNVRPIAELKLGACGLAGYIDFDIGGYGWDGSRRATLVRLARQRAAGKYGELDAGRVVVIGDTVHDIAGAQANGALAIGVASGATTMNELAAAGADVVLPSLDDTDRLVRLVMDGVD